VATHQNKFRLVESNHKEADTKLVADTNLHAADASSSGDTTLRVHSPDRDVLVLLLRWYSAMCQDTAFVAGVGDNHHAINLGPINAALGDKKAVLSTHLQRSGAVLTGRKSQGVMLKSVQ